MHDMKGFDIIFPREYMRAALLVSLLSVWVLVALFYYLNRYTRRHYFTIWMAAWLFYALWLTIGISFSNPGPGSFVIVVREWCVSLSAVFFLWGSLAFLERPTPQTLLGLFIAFLLTWGYVGRILTADPFYVQLATFSLIGLASMFSGLCFYRLRRRRRFVAVGLLILGFFLWGVYLMTYPLSQRYDTLINAGFLFSAVLQLFIAVSMIVLVLEEARHINEQFQGQIEAIESERRELQIKVVSAEEKCRSLFGQARLREELQNAYEELRRTQQSVLQQERLRALGQMASGIAHDINNALSPILAFSELLLRKEICIEEGSRRNIEHIHTAAGDIARIVARMGDFYRRRDRNDQLQLVSMNRLAQEVIELTRPCWRDIPQSRGLEIEIQTDFGDSVPEMYGNETELREALTNLVLNAVDALPKGGCISLSTRAVSQADPLEAVEGPTHVAVEVKDNGIGMDENTRQHCLEPFFSTKQHRGGTGLGLAMVYGTVTRHEGRIEIQSQVDEGTTLRMILPLRTLPQVQQATARAAAKVPSTSLRVLCIDDEPVLRQLLREILTFHHHQVENADGGLAGMELFLQAKKEGRPFDAVITDLGMPGMNGRQLAEQIKTNSPNTPVILLTGWGTMLDDREVEIKADAILSKPPHIDELIETLARVTGLSIAKSSLPNPDAAKPA
jgi:signal transduction histidine kinase/ActR/RegA family two-component response regulator